MSTIYNDFLLGECSYITSEANSWVENIPEAAHKEKKEEKNK